MVYAKAILGGATWLAMAAGCGDGEFNPDGGEALGRALVAARGCPTCHQAAEAKLGTLSGQTLARPDTLAFGANLTPDRATGIGGWADIEIIRALRAGVDNQGAPLCPPMQSYPDMTDLEARAIVAYLRSLPPVRHNVAPSLCPPIKPPPPVDLAMPVAAVDLAVPAVDLAGVGLE